MARFTADTVENYGSSGGTGFFSLKNDKDIATVRFLYNDADDIEGYAVHEVEVGDKKRYVNCLREYNQPIDDCPFCRERKKVIAKLFIPVYNEDEQKVQVWERGKKFFSNISGICSRYEKHPIVSQTFEIERNGKKGDTQTTYGIYRTDDEADDKTLNDYEMPDILGGIILDKSADDMEYYIEEGIFPPTDDEAPVRRSSRSRDEDDEEEERPSRRASRRTPANRGDRF